MIAFLLKLWKWFLKIPVLFAHFPGPALILVVIAIGCASAASSCVTHRLEAGAREKLKAENAEQRARYADERTAAALGRSDAVNEARKEERAIAQQNMLFMAGALRAMAETKSAAPAALAAISAKIEELHNDAKFACRREPLPVPYTDILRIPAGPVSAADPAKTGNHPSQ